MAEDDCRGLRLLIDMDGVIYRGKRPLPGLDHFFEWIRSMGHSYFLVTNNSTRTPAEVVHQLKGFGLDIPPDRIMTSALATAKWLREQSPNGAGVQVIGGPGLLQAVFAAENEFTPDWASPDWVVVGLDQDVTYQKLKDACLSIRKGARFVATNPDTTLPTEEGIVPGAGAIQALITTVTGVQPVVIGKPETILYKMALRLMPEDGGEVVAIGDRLDTDILSGNRIDAKTVLVLTGVSSREDVRNGDIEPDLIFEDLNDLVDNW